MQSSRDAATNRPGKTCQRHSSPANTTVSSITYSHPSPPADAQAYLGFKAARSALKTDEQLAKGAGLPPRAPGFKLYQRGLLMHLTNPKALLGWMATMSLGLGAEASQSTVAIILAGCAVLSVTIFCGYAIIFSTAPMIRAYQRARRVIEGSLAIVFGAAGFKLLMTRF